MIWKLDMIIMYETKLGREGMGASESWKNTLIE